jgi:hypothetical protein
LAWGGVLAGGVSTVARGTIFPIFYGGKWLLFITPTQRFALRIHTQCRLLAKAWRAAQW